MSGAFQNNAFQNNAFQTDATFFQEGSKGDKYDELLWQRDDEFENYKNEAIAILLLLN